MTNTLNPTESAFKIHHQPDATQRINQDSLTIYINHLNSSCEKIDAGVRTQLATSGLEHAESLLASFTDQALDILAQKVSESISYEIKNGALLLPKSKDAILTQIKSGNFVLLPCFNPQTGEFVDFHRGTICYEIFNNAGVQVFEIGSLLRNHRVTTQSSESKTHVVLPDLYEFDPNFTPGAMVLQMAVAKVLKNNQEDTPIILATSRATGSTKALLEAGFRIVDWRKYPMIGATTCDPSCVGDCWVNCDTQGVNCNAKANLTRADMCKLMVHESFTDQMLELAEYKLRITQQNPLNLRIENELSLN